MAVESHQKASKAQKAGYFKGKQYYICRINCTRSDNCTRQRWKFKASNSD